jgi:hypothetical protein
MGVALGFTFPFVWHYFFRPERQLPDELEYALK